MTGFVVYHHDEAGWHWKCTTTDGATISKSDKSFLTRRGAMDDWNQIQRVVNRTKE